MHTSRPAQACGPAGSYPEPPEAQLAVHASQECPQTRPTWRLGAPLGPAAPARGAAPPWPWPTRGASTACQTCKCTGGLSGPHPLQHRLWTDMPAGAWWAHLRASRLLGAGSAGPALRSGSPCAGGCRCRHSCCTAWAAAGASTFSCGRSTGLDSGAAGVSGTASSSFIPTSGADGRPASRGSEGWCCRSLGGPSGGGRRRQRLQGVRRRLHGLPGSGGLRPSLLRKAGEQLLRALLLLPELLHGAGQGALGSRASRSLAVQRLLPRG